MKQTTSDFHKIFDQIEICRLRPGWKNSSRELIETINLNIDKMTKTIALFEILAYHGNFVARAKIKEFQFEDPSRD